MLLIAANYAIRTEWAKQTQFDAEIVDTFLHWANGLPLKVSRLFVPIYFAKPGASPIGKMLVKSAEKINVARNAVVHQGSFSTAGEAEAIITEARNFINAIVGLSICVGLRSQGRVYMVVGDSRYAHEPGQGLLGHACRPFTYGNSKLSFQHDMPKTVGKRLA